MSERKKRVKADSQLTVVRRCELLDVARSTAYYEAAAVSDDDLLAMRLIDETHLRLPFYGSRRIRDELEEQGHWVNRKRMQRLMRQMGLRALYPKPRTSRPGQGHKIYPYLLQGLSIERPNQVWATDICYIPMAKGFMYLVAIMDWATAGSYRGVCRTRWTASFVSRRLRRRCSATAHRRYSTPTRVRNSPPRSSRVCLKTMRLRSAWTARAAGWTTCLWSGCGAASNTKTFIYTPTR